MRITGGELRGRKLSSPKGLRVRPTSDMVRQALFNILNHNYVQDWNAIKVLDLFAGTGALGIEALSRGAKEALFVDFHPVSIDVLRNNLNRLGLTSKAKIVKSKIDLPSKKLLKMLRSQKFHLVFSDAPYSSGLSEKALNLILETGCLANQGIVVVEERKGVEMPSEITSKDLSLRLCDRRLYGQSSLWFYEANQA